MCFPLNMPCGFAFSASNTLFFCLYAQYFNDEMPCQFSFVLISALCSVFPESLWVCISLVYGSFLLWSFWRSALCQWLGIFTSLISFSNSKVWFLHGTSNFVYVPFLLLNFVSYSLIIWSRFSARSYPSSAWFPLSFLVELLGFSIPSWLQLSSSMFLSPHWILFSMPWSSSSFPIALCLSFLGHYLGVYSLKAPFSLTSLSCF